MMLLLENISNGQLPSRSDAIAMRQMLMNSDLMFTPLFLHGATRELLCLSLSAFSTFCDGHQAIQDACAYIFDFGNILAH